MLLDNDAHLLKRNLEKLDYFDEALLSAIDEILRYTLGDACTEIIFNYLEKNCCLKSEIPKRLDKFSEELRRLLGDGKGQILGSAPILEEAIAERFCDKLGVKRQGRLPMTFSIFIRKLKEEYCSKGTEPASVTETVVTSKQ